MHFEIYSNFSKKSTQDWFSRRTWGLFFAMSKWFYINHTKKTKITKLRKHLLGTPVKKYLMHK